ncbi:MAG: insulinase family protein, partial [Bacteroidetes bacterium]|nr:insulinase family protein [Bacteroidota bacterium]
TNPRMDENDFIRLKDLQMNYIKNSLRNENDENLGKAVLEEMLYEDHPYGSIEAGKISSLNLITLDDAKNFYKKYFTQANLTVGIAGNFEKKFINKVKLDLSKLPKGRSNAVKLSQPSKIESAEGGEITLIEKKTMSTAISFGFPINLTRSSKDFLALMIANSYLGEHRTFNGVLMNKMRGDRGLNYGDYSYIENFIQEGGSTFPIPNAPRHQQFFSVWIRPVSNANRHFSLRMAIREIELLIKNGIPQKDFEETKKFLINYSKLWVQTQSRRLGYQIDSDFYETKYLVDEIAKQMPKITKKQVDDAVKKYLNSKNIKVAVVTENAQMFMKDLLENNVSPITYQHSNISQHILDEDRDIQKYSLKINPNKIKIINVENVFE